MSGSEKHEPLLCKALTDCCNGEFRLSLVSKDGVEVKISNEVMRTMDISNVKCSFFCCKCNQQCYINVSQYKS
jgi:hypothetical protein